jgi:hypothetical protein
MASETTRRSIACAIGLAVAVVTAGALAQPTAADKETARALMDQGDEAYKAKDYSAALKAYEAAHRIMGLPSTGIWVAKTRAALGQLVQALDMAVEVTHMPKQPRETAPVVAARTEAETLKTSLASRVPSLLVNVRGPPADAVDIAIDGERLRAPAVGVARKVNPGRHTVVASSPGYTEARTDVSVQEAETKSISLALTSAPGAMTRSAPPAPVAPPPPSSTSTAPQPAIHRSGGVPTSAWIAFSVAGVGVAAGAVTGILSLSQTSAARDECDGDACAMSAETQIDTARGLAWVSNVGFGVGAVGIIVGVVALATSRGGKAGVPTGAHIAAAPGRLAAGFEGAF